MKTAALASFTKDYSEIPGLQRAAHVEYALFGAEGRLHVRVRAVCGGKTRAALCELPGLDAGFARGVVRYLYENAVPVEHVRDILEELQYKAWAGTADADACAPAQKIGKIR